MLIKAEKLGKVYGSGENKVTALHRADMEIAEGDFISILGSWRSCSASAAV